MCITFVGIKLVKCGIAGSTKS